MLALLERIKRQDAGEIEPPAIAIGGFRGASAEDDLDDDDDDDEVEVEDDLEVPDSCPDTTPYVIGPSHARFGESSACACLHSYHHLPLPSVASLQV